MAQLVLVRHAKAADGPVDRERPLTPRGERDAQAIGAILAAHDIRADRVVVSPALRARQTWARAGAETGATVADERIYDNEVDALFAVIRDTPAAVRTLVLVGHNPSFAELADALDDGDGDDAVRRELHAGFAAGGVAIFEISAAWADVGPGTATVRAYAVGRDDS
ncbi:MAG TPA: histidine phosphatase family protein [Jatrophihabitans sp.]|nr:histidine phosphatase family protein [Jatrophihabitans sp.]